MLILKSVPGNSPNKNYTEKNTTHIYKIFTERGRVDPSFVCTRNLRSLCADDNVPETTAWR